MSESHYVEEAKNQTLSFLGILIGYTRKNQPTKAIELYEISKQEILWKGENEKDWKQSNLIVHLCAINALSQIGMSSMSESIVPEIPSHLFDQPMIRNALIDMWV